MRFIRVVTPLRTNISLPLPPPPHTTTITTPCAAVFLEILNLPSYLRFLLPFQLLVALIPGPTEISSNQWFRIFERLVDDLVLLLAGVEMRVRVPGFADLQMRCVQAVLILTTFDTPACRKVRHALCCSGVLIAHAIRFTCAI